MRFIRGGELVVVVDAPEVRRLATCISLALGKGRERRWTIDDRVLRHTENVQIHMSRFTFALARRPIVFHHLEPILLAEALAKRLHHVIPVGRHVQDRRTDFLDQPFRLLENVLLRRIADISR